MGRGGGGRGDFAAEAAADACWNGGRKSAGGPWVTGESIHLRSCGGSLITSSLLFGKTSFRLRGYSFRLRKAIWPEVVVSSGSEVLARSLGCDGTAMDILRLGRRPGACGGDGELGLASLGHW